MKSNLKKRILAAVLCMVMVFSGSSFAMAGDADTTAENGTEVSQDTGTTTTSSGEESQEQTTSGETGETTEGTQETGEQTETTTPETTTPDTTAPETTTGNQETESAPATEEPVQSPAFESSYTVEDGSAVIYASAAEGVFPEGVSFTAVRIDSETDEYSKVEESLTNEAAKTGTDVLDFVAYDITFYDAQKNEIEPNGEVQISIEFSDVKLDGASEESTTVSVVHVKDDASTETVQSDIDIDNNQLNKVDFATEEFSIYAVTSSGISSRESSTIEAGDLAVIEFWDKNNVGSNQEITFQKANYVIESDKRYLRVNIYLENEPEHTNLYLLMVSESDLQNVNLQTTVKPGEGYYLAKECEWIKANADSITKFGGSGSTGMNKADDSREANTLNIYLTRENPNSGCSTEVTGTKEISVDLYNYDTEAYNNAVELNSNSLLIRSAWGNYKSDGYGITSGNNAHNESCGDYGIYYGLVKSVLDSQNNIQFNKTSRFFDSSFDNGASVGTKYENVAFEFVYNSNTKEYSYNSEENHVHFDQQTNTISQHTGTGPHTLSDGSDLSKTGFFPFTDENDNMTNYGFGMRMDVEFRLTEDGTIDGTNPMTFSFSGDDDVWVFVDGQLALDLGGIHARRGGTINFADKTVTYDEINKDGKIGQAQGVDGTTQPNVNFLKNLKPGVHTLTMYYLERGGNDSNCEIKFNLLTVEKEAEFAFDKKESGTNRPIGGIGFSLYDTNEITDETVPIATAESNDAGKVTFSTESLDVSKTYYLKETSTSWQYKPIETLYTVKFETETRQGTEYAVAKLYDSSNKEVTTVYNEKSNVEPVNFYLNLSSKILDTTGNITGQSNGDFTTSVSGNQSAIDGDQGIGVPINADLMVKLPASHEHVGPGGTLGVIGSDTSVNAVVADRRIRALKSGTTGTVSGQTDKMYQIVNEDGEDAFPTDEEIFEYIRTNWKTDENGVNKGKDITVNGVAINVNNLTTANFVIRWYVFKDHHNDYWHIDGILVPKSGILNVTKTFPSESIAALAQESKFAVNVTGNFLTEAGDNQTIKNTIDNAEKTVNNDGTVTYTWSLSIFGTKYEIKEVNYELSSEEYVFSSAEWSYLDADNNLTTGEDTSATVVTKCDSTDIEHIKTQTFALSNYYTFEDNDNPYITVSKTFKGLSMVQIEELYDTFSLTVETKDGETVRTLKLNDSGVSVSPDYTDKDIIQDYTFTWKVENCETGTYKVIETGATVGQYEVSTTGVGENVDVSAATWIFDPNVVTITANDAVSFTVGNNKIIMAALTGSTGYFIWTNEQLTSAQQAAVISTINYNADFQKFQTGEATKDNCHFYYGNALEQGITLGKGTITYILPEAGSPEGTPGTLVFGNKNVWRHVLAGSYTMTNAVNADIGVVNTYTANLDLVKVSAGTNAEISGAKFELSKLSGYEWKLVKEQFEVVNGEDSGAELSELEPGVLYRLTEIQAPNAHSLLDEPIYFKAEKGSISLCNARGEVISSAENDMWMLSIDNNKLVLTIKNNVLYSLPSAGGPGIYWYTIGGMLLMIAGTLVLYKNKRREVLKR